MQKTLQILLFWCIMEEKGGIGLKIRLFFQKCEDVEISHNLTPETNGECFERHCHAKYELLYILDGKGSYTVEGAEYPLLPHSLFLLRPYEYHYVRTDVGRPYDRVVIYFETGALPAAILDHPLLTASDGNYFALSSVANPVRAAFEALLGGIETLSKDGARSAPASEALLRASLTQILLLLTQETPTSAANKEASTVRRVIDYLNMHLEDELSLDLLTKEFYISKYHLCRVFREQTGVTLFAYYNTKRMMLAQKWIAEGRSASSVSARLGFRDYSTFYRAYKKHTGEAPKRSLAEKPRQN